MPEGKDLAQAIQTKVLAFLEKSALNGIFQKGSEVVGLPKVVLFEIGAVTTIAIVVLLLGAEFVVDLLTFVYPAISSLKTIEGGSKLDHIQWISYWITFFTIQTLENALPFIFSNIPFYFWLKLGFLVWCYYPLTKGSSVLYKLLEPVRAEIIPILDTYLSDFLPKSTKSDTDATVSSTSSDAYIPSGISVYVDTLQISNASSELATKAIYLEMYLADGSSKVVGAKYKTPSLTGASSKFDYTLTIVPPTDILNQAGATLFVILKERLTFGDDTILYSLKTPIDIATLQSDPRGSSPGGDSDMVSVSIGKRLLSLSDDTSAVVVNGWIELISDR